jgi:biopolymer transport protein ExbB
MIEGIILQAVQTIGTASDTLSQALPSTAPPPAMSLLELIIKGGPVMIPLLILSILTVYLTVERMIILRRASKTDTASMMDSIKEFVMAGKIDAAIAYCKKEDSPVARMIEKGIRRIGKPLPEIEEDIETVGKMELYKLEKNVGILGTIAGIAPMFGFLGTIFGVIKIFYNISLADNISIGNIADGLYVKMITSAAGLMIGIVAYVCHHLLVMWMDRIVNRMEHTAIEFMDILQEPTK